jgi:hypothetical protein
MVSKDYQILNQDVVISMDLTDNPPKFVSAILPHPTAVVKKAIKYLASRLIAAEEFSSQLVDSGVACNVLIPNQGWTKGRIRLCFEFCPDENEDESTKAINSEQEQAPDLQNLDELDEIRLSVAEESSNGQT